MDANEKAVQAEDAILSALGVLHINKPEGRSELARRYAVAITELEKVHAYVALYIRGAHLDEKGGE